MSVDKSELPYFSPEQANEEVLLDEERTAMLEVVSLSFDGRYKWRFFDGSATFTADIADEGVFASLRSGRVAFGKGDVLEVRLHVKTYRTENGHLRTEYNVLKVIRVIQAVRQIEIPFDESEKH